MNVETIKHKITTASEVDYEAAKKVFEVRNHILPQFTKDDKMYLCNNNDLLFVTYDNDNITNWFYWTF